MRFLKTNYLCCSWFLAARKKLKTFCSACTSINLDDFKQEVKTNGLVPQHADVSAALIVKNIKQKDEQGQGLYKRQKGWCWELHWQDAWWRQLLFFFFFFGYSCCWHFLRGTNPVKKTLFADLFSKRQRSAKYSGLKKTIALNTIQIYYFFILIFCFYLFIPSSG